jgi:hypothetical protein
MRRNLLILLTVTLVLALAGAGYVWDSINGRGGREAIGQRYVTSDAAGPSIVFFERRPAGRESNLIPIVLMASFARGGVCLYWLFKPMETPSPRRRMRDFNSLPRIPSVSNSFVSLMQETQCFRNNRRLFAMR